MFTGIVTDIGTLVAVDKGEQALRVEIRSASIADGIRLGDSVAVQGVCLSVVAHEDDVMSFDVVAESIHRSALGTLVEGDGVNLERPMAASGRFDGHIVQGHVDGVGVVDAIHHEGDARRIRLIIPDDLAVYVVEKGSIGIDGVSLTLTAVSDRNEANSWCEFVLIPHTLEHTTLGGRCLGDRVNVEVDVLAKYVERMIGTHT